METLVWFGGLKKMRNEKEGMEMAVMREKSVEQ